jgi:hypothetical protein
MKNHELQELTAEICETVDWPEFHRVDAVQNEQVRAILERFMAKHYQYEDALVAVIPKMMQQAESSSSTRSRETEMTQAYPRPAKPAAAFYTRFRDEHQIKPGEALSFPQWMEFAEAYASSRRGGGL